MTTRSARRTRARQRGAGMIETLVGILIGLLVVLVVYNILSVAEGYKRATMGAADAQITGLLSQFVSSRDAANGGNGISSAFADLINCRLDEAGNLFTSDNTLRPVPLLITAGALDSDSDSFVSWQSGSPHVIWPVEFRPPAPGVTDYPAGANILVQSPNGFSTPAGASLPTAAVPYWVIAMANDGTGRCKLLQITNASAPDVDGITTLTQGAIKTTIVYKGVPVIAGAAGAKLLILGPERDATRIRYDVANNQMRTTECMNTCGVPNPVAQNVVLMKVQYGIDTSATPDGTVDCWTPAVDGVCGGNWSPAEIIKAGDPGVPSAVLNRILAVRLGVVVRSDEPDLRNPSLVQAPGSTVDGQAGNRQDTYLFNCAADTDLDCPNRVLIPAGAAAPNVLLDGWRYRTYETVVPLRNPIFNATLVAP